MKQPSKASQQAETITQTQVEDPRPFGENRKFQFGRGQQLQQKCKMIQTAPRMASSTNGVALRPPFASHV